MSIKTMSRVWESSQHAGSELLMLLAIADFSDDDGKSFPAVSTLAEKCRMKERNCQYIIRSLETSGELSIFQNAGLKGSNLYRINFDAMGVHHSAGVQSLAGVHHSAPGGAIQRQKGVHCIAPKPSVNRQQPSTRASDAPDSDKSNRSCSHSSSLVVDDGFADFWKQYPKKVAKPAAEKAWRKLKPSGQMHADLLAGLKKQKASDQWQKDGGKFIPHPATWLNQRRWEDAGEGASLSDDDREWLKTGNLSAPLPADDDRSWLMGGKP